MKTIQQCKILLVDDSIFFREQMKRILSGASIGRKYYEARDGREAISQYIQNKPDLVLMDIVMPNTDGVKATQAIKKFDPDAKILVFSTKENKNSVEDAIHAGANNYILKPFDSGIAVTAILKTLSIGQEKINPNKNEVSETMAHALFDESFSAISEFNEKKTARMHEELEYEKRLMHDLNEKLNQNLLKISNAEIELVKKKEGLEEELNIKTKQLLDSERLTAIGELSARLAHDLRNPISVINMAVELIKHHITETNTQDSPIAHKIGIIENGVARMTHQVNGVLGYVRNTPLEKSPTSIKEMFQKSISYLDISKNITITSPEIDIIYNCDPIKMEAVFTNLILNSIQAIGADDGHIIVKFDETPTSIIIIIEDSGAGIPNDDITRVFEPLFTTKQEGTGLGLTSVKCTIEAHGGTIDFKNNPTTFTISLPK